MATQGTQTNADLAASLVQQAGDVAEQDPEQALAFLERAVEADPANADARFWRGIYLARTEQFKEAIAALEGIEQQTLTGTQSAILFFWRAISFNSLGEYQKALDAVQAAEASAEAGLDRGILLLQKGIALVALNRPQEALSALSDAAPQLNGLALANCLLQKGKALMLGGDFAQAESVLRESIARTTNDPQALQIRWNAQLHLAGSLARQGKNQDSLSTFAESLQEIQQNPAEGVPNELRVSLWRGKAEMAMTLGRVPEAARAFEEVEKANPAVKADPGFWFVKTVAYVVAGEQEHALADPPHEVENHPFVIAYRGGMMQTFGRWEEAQALLPRAAAPVETYATDPLAWLGVGLASFNLNRYPETIQALNKAAELDSSLRSSPLLVFPLSLALVFTEKNEEAWQLLKDAEGPLFMAKALALKGLNRLPEALEIINQAPVLGIAPMDAMTRFWKGQILLDLDRKDEALKCFEESATLTDTLAADNPVRLLAALGHATVLIRMGRREEALDVLQQATRVDPSTGFAKRAIGWQLIAGLLEDMERHEEALQALHHAQSLEPANPDILISRGKVLTALEDYKNAEVAFGAALALAQNDETRAEALTGQADAEKHGELYEEAISAYRRACALRGDANSDWRIWIGLGECYRALNRYEAALSTFREGWRRQRGARKSAEFTVAISSALIDRSQNQEAVDFLTAESGKVEPDARLDFNLGLALLRLKQPEAAKRAWEKAALDFPQAAEYLQQMKGTQGARGDWLSYWFGAGVSLWRKSLGTMFAVTTLIVALLPIVKKEAFQNLHGLRWLNTGEDYKVLGFTLLTLLLFILGPTLKSLSLGVGPLKLDAAAPETGEKTDINALLMKVQAAGTESVVGQQVSAGASRIAGKSLWTVRDVAVIVPGRPAGKD